MPPRKSVDEKLAELEDSVAGAEADEVVSVLGKALAERNYRVVAHAAHLAGERLVYDCVPQLIDAFEQLLDNAVKRDPNCLAKKAIMRALYELDCDDADFYLAGIRYSQLEPVWGGTVDTAADLRCSAAMGLVASGYPRAMIEVAALLTDSEAPVRSGAARAIACGNPHDAEMLLRFKVLTGDAEALVIGDCFAGLLGIEPDESVDFVAVYLGSEDDALREAAALALGESRLPRALDRLLEAWDEVFVPEWFRRVLVRAAALHRSNESFAWLVGLAAEVNEKIATEIVEALSIYRHKETLADQLRAALARRSDPNPGIRFEETWV